MAKLFRKASMQKPFSTPETAWKSLPPSAAAEPAKAPCIASKAYRFATGHCDSTSQIHQPAQYCQLSSAFRHCAHRGLPGQPPQRLTARGRSLCKLLTQLILACLIRANPERRWWADGYPTACSAPGSGSYTSPGASSAIISRRPSPVSAPQSRQFLTNHANCIG